MNKKDERQLKTPYFDKLKEYTESKPISLDVPGHKLGRLNNELLEYTGPNIFKLDANAPKGLDNLSKPKGVIKEAQDLMAEAFGADQAYFLTNGTTQGILAVIMSVCRANHKILLPRNVHKSIINGLILSGAIPVFMKPNIDNSLGIANGVSVETVREAINDNPDAKAVFLINPTYFGVVSDMREIVKLAHEHEMKVIVDEAHGGHFYFSDKLPLGAIEAGADLSVVSTHKNDWIIYSKFRDFN
jgi:arginine decarboxylase